MLFSGSSDPISPQQLPNWSYTGFVPLRLSITPHFVFVNTKNEEAVMLALYSGNKTLHCWTGSPHPDVVTHLEKQKLSVPGA
jgi:hypothetical protein